MQVRTLFVSTFAALALAAAGSAQMCSLTTTFASNNGQSGNMFDIVANNTVVINGFDINVDPGTWDVEIYVVTGGGTWQGNETNPMAWTLVGTALGVVSNGTDNPTPVPIAVNTMINAGATQGFYVTLSNGTAINYTNGSTVGNVFAQDLNIQFIEGSGKSYPFGSTFAPRVWNGNIIYSTPGNPCFSSVLNTVGAGTGGSPMHMYEDFATPGSFDLVDTAAGTSTDLLFGSAGNTVTAVPSGGTPIVPPVAPDLGLGDDQNSDLIPLGFTYDGAGICADSISVASNGYIWFGALGRADFSESEAEFVNEGRRLACYWNDLNPTAGGSIHVDIGPGMVTVTYMGVFLFGGSSPEVTCQVEITPGTIRVRYDPAGGAYAADPFVGLGNGVQQAPPGSSDFTAGPVGPLSGSGDLILTSDTTARIGGAPINLSTSGIPGGAVGGTVFAFGSCLSPGIALPTPQFAPGSEQLVGSPNITLGLLLGGTCHGTLTIGALPNDPAFLGQPFCVQSAAFGGGAISVSNGLDFVIGNS